jgi:hypothetical protein
MGVFFNEPEDRFYGSLPVGVMFQVLHQVVEIRDVIIVRALSWHEGGQRVDNFISCHHGIERFKALLKNNPIH